MSNPIELMHFYHDDTPAQVVEKIRDNITRVKGALFTYDVDKDYTEVIEKCIPIKDEKVRELVAEVAKNRRYQQRCMEAAVVALESILHQLKRLLDEKAKPVAKVYDTTPKV